MILDLSVLLAISLSLWLNFLKFEKNMPHAVLKYRPKRRLTKRHLLRIVKLNKQNKNKFPKLIFLGLQMFCANYVITLAAVVTLLAVLFGCSCLLYAVKI